jgi:hypothetical protein
MGSILLARNRDKVQKCMLTAYTRILVDCHTIRYLFSDTRTHTSQAYLRELADSTLRVTHLGIQETLPSAIMVTACTKEASREAMIQAACRTIIRLETRP